MRSFLICLVLSLVATFASAQTTPTAPKPSMPPQGPSMVAGNLEQEDSVIVTIILKHQQNKNLPEIRRILEAQGFWDIFPPDDARVMSWNLAMGLGHVVTLMVPVSSVRRLNLALENGAWGAFDTEIYLSYDYKEVWEEYMERRSDAKEDRN
ncbi:MAG: hypothetical protein J0L99_21195 [Chitinophagales bacterium]|nr:hypothetical protein [Chitinophagales bacterium]